MKLINLTLDEFNYLNSPYFLPDRIIKLMKYSIDKEQNLYQLRITEEEADTIRDLCGEQLQLIGFDENYNPNAEGKILESLVDKFFC